MGRELRGSDVRDVESGVWWQDAHVPSLTREEALARADLLSVTRMEVEIDLDQGAESFGSLTRIHLLAAADGETFVDVKPTALHGSISMSRPGAKGDCRGR